MGVQSDAKPLIIESGKKARNTEEPEKPRRTSTTIAVSIAVTAMNRIDHSDDCIPRIIIKDKYD